MGIENHFFYRTGGQWIDSLEPLACPLNDSAYRFRSLQMRYNVTPTLRCFGSERSKHGTEAEALDSLVIFHVKDNNMVTCNTSKVYISSNGGNTSNMQKHLATQRAIHLQDCCVFDTLLLSESSSSGANGMPSIINAEGNLKLSSQDRPCLLS